MKALVLEEYGKFVFRDVPDPVLRDENDIIVRVRAAAICGSDVHGMDGSTGRRRPPIIMGHEASGEIAAVGGRVKRFRTGDRITFDSTEYCGECFYCRRGDVNLCDNRSVLGVSCAEYSRAGTFAEQVVVPERIVYAMPAGVDFVEASLAEPAAVAAHAAAITPIALGDSIIVVGTGLIGLLLIQILRFVSGGMGSVLVSNSQKPGIYAKVHIHGSSGASAGVQTDGGAMFIAGMSSDLEPPYNDLWTIPGQESLLPVWKAEDEAFFSKIDPTWYFFALQIAEFSESVRAGRAPAVTGEDGRETVRIFEGVYRDRNKNVQS